VIAILEGPEGNDSGDVDEVGSYVSHPGSCSGLYRHVGLEYGRCRIVGLSYLKECEDT